MLKLILVMCAILNVVIEVLNFPVNGPRRLTFTVLILLATVIMTLSILQALDEILGIEKTTPMLTPSGPGGPSSTRVYDT